MSDTQWQQGPRKSKTPEDAPVAIIQQTYTYLQHFDAGIKKDKSKPPNDRAENNRHHWFDWGRFEVQKVMLLI